MTSRIIVHAGFHKTGTSSLQDYIRANHSALAPYVTAYLKEDFLKAANAGRIYGLKPYPWRLWQFRKALRDFLAEVDPAGVMFLSWEGFSGVMPGHKRLFGRTVMGYRRAALPLARVLVAEIRARFGSDVEVEFLYTVRAKDVWIRSVWGHLVRSIRLTETATEFAKRLQNVVPLEDEAAHLALDLAPVPVRVARLEVNGTSVHGPASALLDQLDLPEAVRAALPPAKRANVGMSHQAEDAFLQLNREERDGAALKARKDRIAQAEWQRQG